MIGPDHISGVLATTPLEVSMFTRVLPFLSVLCSTACAEAPAPGATGATGGTDSAETHSLTGSDVAGQWVSAACEAYPDGQGGQSFLTRDFTLTDTTWSLDVSIFGDQDCSYPLFSAQIDGPFLLSQPAEQIEGAVHGDFSFSSIVWTAHDQLSLIHI